MRLNFPVPGPEGRQERLLTSPVGNYFRLEEPPFWSSLATVGDLVGVRNGDGQLYLHKKEGHSLFRLRGPSSIVLPPFPHRYFGGCTRRCLQEGDFSTMAVDVPPFGNAWEVAQIMEDAARDTGWVFEPVFIRQHVDLFVAQGLCRHLNLTAFRATRTLSRLTVDLPGGGYAHVSIRKKAFSARDLAQGRKESHEAMVEAWGDFKSVTYTVKGGWEKKVLSRLSKFKRVS